jgi:hypothetical protein
MMAAAMRAAGDFHRGRCLTRVLWFVMVCSMLAG